MRDCAQKRRHAQMGVLDMQRTRPVLPRRTPLASRMPRTELPRPFRDLLTLLPQVPTNEQGDIDLAAASPDVPVRESSRWNSLRDFSDPTRGCQALIATGLNVRVSGCWLFFANKAPADPMCRCVLELKGCTLAFRKGTARCSGPFS